MVFYGINIMKDEEHNPDLITGRVRVVFGQMHKIQTIVINKYKWQKYITPPTISFVWILFGLLHREPK